MLLIDLLLHRVPWDGDKIRLYRDSNNPSQRFIGEFWIKIKHGEVLVLDNTDRTYIRRDLPRWSSRFECWTYEYAGLGC